MSAYHGVQARVGAQGEERRRAEQGKTDAERRARLATIRERTAIGSALVLALLAIVISLRVSSTRAEDVASEVAEVSTSGQVASVRAASLAQVRGGPGQVCDAAAPSLWCINLDLRAAGLDPVPDPGAGATAYQVAAAIGRAGGRLDALRELRARGVALPGVTIPGSPGPFPGGTGR